MLIGLFIALLLLIFLGVPVIFAIGFAALVGVLLNPNLPAALFPQRMFAMLDSFSLLALPYFILAGEIMSRGGISKRLVSFARACVGHLRGGLGMASVVASMIFAGVSGSSTADTSAVGSILIPSMKDNGYKPGFAASLLASAGTIGPIIPPSMTMIVYGSMAGVSIGGLFLAGVIPGVLIGVGLMVLIYLYSFIKNYPELRRREGRFSPMEILRCGKQVWTALIAPLIILGGILLGIFTATEAGVIACIYAMLVSFFVYKSLKLRDLPKIFLDSAVTTTVVVGIIATAGAFGWLLAYLDFNEVVFKLLSSISTSPMIVLMLLLGCMLFLTMFVESLAVLVLLVPVMVYISTNFGFNSLHFGLLMVMATQIGAVTPPVGVLLYVATGIAGNTFDDTVRYVWPFVATLIAVMLLVAFFPSLATWIPAVFMR